MLPSRYAASWFNNRIMGGHEPIQPQTYQKMPREVRRYVLPGTGYSRDDAYEYHLNARPVRHDIGTIGFAA
eukprot:SAG31_NODE_5888_length_2273_cov_1.429163_2_plen_71_part_00